MGISSSIMGELNGVMIETPDNTDVVQGPPWYVVHIRNQHEAKVESGLWARGMEVFVPRITGRSRRKDRIKLLEAPLFSCCVFVYTRMSPAPITPLFAKMGGRSCGWEGILHPVPADTVAAIRSITGSGKPCYHWLRLVAGRRVQVAGGPLAGATDTLCQESGKRYLVAGVKLLGQSLAVELDQEDEEAAQVS